MIGKCCDCKEWFDDEFRTTICPHEPFPANDGLNYFETKNDSVGPASGDSCPKCKSPVNVGFGLAGGGFGPYVYCSSEKCDYFEKFQDETA